MSALAVLAHRAVRLPLRLIPKDTVMTVRDGPNQGLRWIAGASVHACWVGTYERETAGRVAALIRPGMRVWDVGANVGFYTLLFAKRVGAHGTVVAFEPETRAANYIHRHLTLNGFGGRCAFLGVALSDHVGSGTFSTARGDSQGKLDPNGNEITPVYTVDYAVEHGGGIPDLLKIDVEGEEGRVLAGATETLHRYRPLVVISTHNEEAFNACQAILHRAYYETTNERGGIPTPGGDIFATPLGNRIG